MVMVRIMKKIYKDYLMDKIKLKKWQIIGIFCLIIVISGMFGWLYEYIFYYFNSGMKTWYWRGANFLPWINIYATGSIMIIILTHKFKKNPLLVFLITALSTGILEYFSGLAMLELKGMRCWDYNTEILNFGNIDGFVCLRSVTIFGLCGMLLVYGVIPLCIYFSKHINKKVFLIVSISLCSIFLFDELYNLLFSKILDTPRASHIYKDLGFHYMNYYK